MSTMERVQQRDLIISRVHAGKCGRCGRSTGDHNHIVTWFISVCCGCSEARSVQQTHKRVTPIFERL